MAVASCVPGEVVVVPVLVPGTGAAASQANLNGSSGDPLVADLQAGQTAQQVIANVTAPSFDASVAQRQYGVVTMTGTAAGYSGTDIPNVFGASQNADQTASVQGNTLASEAVLTQTLAAYDAAAGQPLPTDCWRRSAGSAAGVTAAAARTASSAALLVAKPGDPVWNQTSAGFHVDINKVATPSIFVSVVPGGKTNPVDTLNQAYREAAAKGTPVKVQQLPWMLRTFGVPSAVVWLAAAAIGLLVIIIGESSGPCGACDAGGGPLERTVRRPSAPVDTRRGTLNWVIHPSKCPSNTQFGLPLRTCRRHSSVSATQRPPPAALLQQQSFPAPRLVEVEVEHVRSRGDGQHRPGHRAIGQLPGSSGADDVDPLDHEHAAGIGGEHQLGRGQP